MEKNLEEYTRVVRIRNEDDLSLRRVSTIQPTQLFFPHWSWRIPREIYDRYECVIFHMTDLPFGRGGSPLQNLIVRGYTDTVVTAFQCIEELDAGPVYLKEQCSLSGTAEEIFLRVNSIIESMILTIFHKDPKPEPQIGEPTYFKRRKLSDGDIERLSQIDKVFDYIRMLDADGYPKAFAETEHLLLEFSNASQQTNEVLANVRIRLKSRNES